MECSDKHQFEKSPAGSLDYQFDWSAWLGATDKIKAVTCSIDDGLTAGSQTWTDTAVTIWLSGGQLLKSYQVRCTVQTEGGRMDRRTALLTIRNLSESSASRVYHVPADPDRVDLSPEGPHYG